MSNKFKKLKNLICSENTSFIMEAHNGISSKIVEEVGFKGIWASGLSISASLGVRDNNEASWTQVLEVIEFMSDSTSIPILLDGDTGYGNFNNMRRLVSKLEQRNIAGVCIEDKLFPKTNSFINSEKQPLADINEFSGKIKAAKDTQLNDNFCVVARIEAFIAGWGLEEALKRAMAYKDAGADALLIHSKRSDARDIEDFVQAWKNEHPLVIVPTKYYSTPTEVFKNLGINLVIWANHNIRASVKAMKDVSKNIFDNQTLNNVEGSIAAVHDIFKLQGDDELRIAEKKYLPTSGNIVNAIILAASKGKELGDLTNKIPKTMLKVRGKPILSWQVDSLFSLGVRDISVVCGYKEEKINVSKVKKVFNKDFKSSTDLFSLYLALLKNSEDDLIISYGDIIYKEYILHSLLSNQNDLVIVVDKDFNNEGRTLDCVKMKGDFEHFFNNEITLENIFSSNFVDLEDQEIDGEFIGLWKIKKEKYPKS